MATTSLKSTMDTPEVLTFVKDILAVAELHAKLISVSNGGSAGASPHEVTEAALCGRAKDLVSKLSKNNAPALKQVSLGKQVSSNHVRALQDLAYNYVRSCGLEQLQAIPRYLYREHKYKTEQITYDLTNLTYSILRSRVAELRQEVESLKKARDYIRPETQARVNAMSQDLDRLQAEILKRTASLEAKSPILLTSSDVESFGSQILSLNEMEDSFLVDRIVASLNYDSRPARLDSVPKAHKDTFQWAFDSKLSAWLRSESRKGTFWVSGKPGSGKSTFMKFITKHPRTKEMLTEWASSADSLAIATHFFWIAGTPIQKSWQGLLQSLLYDIFNKRPSVVSYICPDRWQAAKAGNWQVAAQAWTVNELAQALRALAASAETLKLKMCFFIDGLDEYDSDLTELCNVLHDMADSPNVKMCVSSRPWTVFEKSFGSNSEGRVDIHELTRDDVRNFIHDELRNHPRWRTDEATAARLLDQIVFQADGVFIWALFVTRWLKEDLSKGKDVTGLHKRLSGLPTDLNQLFINMLETVASVDRSKMAGILQVAAHALEPLHVDLYQQVEKQFEEYEHAYHCAIEYPASLQQVFKQREQACRSIDEKTKGLLRIVNQRVEFLHRTVKDFTLTRDTETYLRCQLPKEYDGFLSIAGAYLGFLKTTRQNGSLVAGIVRLGWGQNSGPFISHLNQALVYASESLRSAASASGHPQHGQTFRLLEHYEIAIEEMLRVGHVTMAGPGAEACDPRAPFREELLRHEMAPYIAHRLCEQRDFLGAFDEPPLFAALTPMSRNGGESPAPVREILKMLLERDEDPNATRQLPQSSAHVPVEAASPWMLFARGTMSVFNMLSGPSMFPAMRWNESLDNGIFDLLLSHGADPNKALIDRPGAHTAFSHFLDISLSEFLGHECFQGYVRTLDAFLRAGGSLDVPSSGRFASTDDAEVAAFGNLARTKPQDYVLASYCDQLKTLQALLVADPERAKFVSTVNEKLVLQCGGREDHLRTLSSAISAAFSTAAAESLLALIESELTKTGKTPTLTRKRRRDS